MKRKLFCEISPLTYKISMEKCILVRKISNLLSKERFACKKSEEKLPFSIYKHNSLIRRRLGNVNMELQNNKAINLGVAAPKISGIIIKFEYTLICCYIDYINSIYVKIYSTVDWIYIFISDVSIYC